MKWLQANWEQLPGLVGQHLVMSLPAIALSVVIALPIGRLAQRHRLVGAPLLGAASLLYAIPALPLFVVIPVVFGLPLRSLATMLVALTIYGVALLVRTAADAFGSVSAAAHESALALGHSRSSIFWRVDLPLAVPVLVSGIRVMTVSTVNLVTLGALIGQSGLGVLLTDGFQRGIATEVASGVVLTVVLAVVLDGLVVLVGRLLTPWTAQSRRSSGSKPNGSRPSRSRTSGSRP